jgi:hypothetical protein
VRDGGKVVVEGDDVVVLDCILLVVDYIERATRYTAVKRKRG